jgi:hypothetical protein
LTFCLPILDHLQRNAAWAAEVRDLSAGGVGLVLRRRFEVGTALFVHFGSVDPSAVQVLLVKVMHTTCLSDGAWLLGCAFVTELANDELRRLLPLCQPPAA